MASLASPTAPAPPPTSALPSLPVSKLRAPSSSSPSSADISRGSSPFAAKPSLRTPSKIGKPPLSSSNSASASNLPSLATTTATKDAAPKENNSPVRRSVSIANFPQPPRVGKAEADAESLGALGLGINARTSSLRSSKKLRTKASTGSLNQLYSSSGTPSLLNGSGEKNIVAGMGVVRRQSSGLASAPSRRHSSSSADGSYSTSATNYEDIDDKRASAERGRLRDSQARDKESKGNVTVSVRIRPDAGVDKSAGKDWLVDARQSLIAYQGREGGDYYYDNVFGQLDKNHKIYDTSAKRLVRRVMEGYHGTVFAYGMTGTGKTFSMQGTRDSPGIIPLAITDIFSYIRETPSREFLLRVSYLEIYNEKIHDLLAPPSAAGPTGAQQEEIKLREDSKRGVYATPLKEEIVQSPTQLLRVIARGDQCRKTRSTQYNAQSSRSHAIVQIVVESRERAAPSGKVQDKRAGLVPGGVRVSTLSMIDLAGSERAADSKERQKEGAHINKSLLTLGTVVSKLSGDKDGQGNPTDKEGKHLPYRDSKLTRLLQPALSGNSIISILCTIQIGAAGSVASAGMHIGETLNTLKFAARARNNIVSHAKRAEEAFGAAGDGGSRVLLERYRLEIADLKTQLEDQRKDQLQKDEAERKEAELDVGQEQRHEEQMLEIHLARTALQRRMDDLKRLILSSQSSGVNASGKMSSLGSNQPRRSLRSSASHSTLGRITPALSRNLSIGSSVTVGRQEEPTPKSPSSSLDNEDEEVDDMGDGTASAKAQITSLQADLADKNRYIATLEKRLLQARRSSHSRTSLLLTSPTSRQRSSKGDDDFVPVQVVQEKDAEIADLRATLEDKERMVNALRVAARNRDNAAPSTPLASSDAVSPVTANEHPEPLSPRTAAPKRNAVSPVAILTPSAKPTTPPQTQENTHHTHNTHPSSPTYPNANGNSTGKRKSIDEMTKILDGMIQDRVQTGGLVMGANGAVRVPVPLARKESVGGGAVPSVGALAAQLRPVSTANGLGDNEGTTS